MEIYKQIDSGTGIFEKKLIPLSQTSLSGESLKFTKAERTDLSGRFLGNLFASFNLPITVEQIQKFTTGTYAHTAFQYLNQDSIIVVEIPKNSYGELIDGKSIELSIPLRDGSSMKLHSTFFKNSLIDSSGHSFYSDPNQQSAEFGQAYVVKEIPGQAGLPNPISGYSSNVAYMFSDTIHKPAGNHNYSWNTSSKYFTTQTNLPTGTMGAKFAANYSSSDGVVDIPAGIAYLDKGFIVLTHPYIIANFAYEDAQLNGAPYTGDDKFTGINFSGKAALSFTSFVTEFVQHVVCIALPNEFYKSSNPTFEEAYGPDNVGNNPVAITEIGLYNDKYELIAIAKSNKPLAKSKSSVLSFDITIRV